MKNDKNNNKILPYSENTNPLLFLQVSCLRGPNRHYRHSSGGVASPQSSPSAGSKATILAKSAGVKQSPAGSGPTAVGGFDRGMLDLVDLFVRQVLRWRLGAVDFNLKIQLRLVTNKDMTILEERPPNSELHAMAIIT